MKIRKGSKMFNFAMETQELFLSNTFYVLCQSAIFISMALE